MNAKPRPREGDLVLYARQRGEGGRYRTLTGRVVERHTWGVRVEPTTYKRNHRVEWGDLKGWWPWGTPDRSLDNLRAPEVQA